MASEKVSVKNEGDETSFLRKQYEKLTFISDKCAMKKYLNVGNLERYALPNMPIFPFGLNLSQQSATEKALTEQISIIEGPPGTGKTQTILNIVANAIMSDKTVAVVSNNNSATANVLEKLQKQGVDFIAAYLGNTENKEKFFANQTYSYPDMSAWKMDLNSYNVLKRGIMEEGNKLKSMLYYKNRVAILKQEKSDLLVEKEYFYTYLKDGNEELLPYKSIYKHNSDTVMKLLVEIRLLIKMEKDIGFLDKLKYFLKYGITNFSFYKNSSEKIISYLQKQYYDLKLKELNEGIQKLSKRLESFKFEDNMKKYSENSMRLFTAKLADRFGEKAERIGFDKDSLWKGFSSFIKEYPVIMSTTHSLKNCASENYLFDYVIIDEASQVDIVTGALALSCARNAIIVGDIKQLPNVASDTLKRDTKEIFEKFHLDPAYSYEENSILTSFLKLYKNIPRTLLKEHYSVIKHFLPIKNSDI